MKHKAKITISRPSCSDGRKKINIYVEDSDARIQFLDLEIGLENFAECLTGLGHVECEIMVRGLENVGKQIETGTIEFELPEPQYIIGKKEVVELAKKHTPKGWVCSEYFGSRDSFRTKDGKTFANTKISRWVEK